MRHHAVRCAGGDAGSVGHADFAHGRLSDRTRRRGAWSMTPPRARILIVDDHEENLLALEAVLNEPGYELVRANSGRAALRAALQGDFAVVLLDVAMPDMD